MNRILHQIDTAPLPRSVRHSISAAILCWLVAFTAPVLFGQGQESSKSIPVFELANQTFYNAVLQIRNDQLMVTHSGGIYSHNLGDMYYKTLQRIANSEPALRSSVEYHAALGRFVPSMMLNDRAATGVRLEDLVDGEATFLTDDGVVTCRWSEVAESDRVPFMVDLLLKKKRSDQLAAAEAQVERERQQQQLLAESVRAQELENQRIIAAQQAAAQQAANFQREKEAQQIAETTEGVIGVAIAGVALWGLYELLSGASSEDSSQAQFDNDAAYRANRRAADEWDARVQREAEQRERDRVEQQWQQRRAFERGE